MDIIGKASINPLLFYSGKLSGYFTWIIYALSPFGCHVFDPLYFKLNVYISVILLCISFIFIIISLINLGNSTRLGLPEEETELKTTGIYKISRNPMYLGFNLLTISSVVYFLNIWVILMGLYSIVIYHFIILAEEKFLEERFKKDFVNYRNITRRYI